MRNLKIIGLAIVAVLALSAVGASAASAAPTYSCNPTGGGSTCDFTAAQAGAGKQVFKAGATVECTGVTGEGSFITGAASIETSKIAYTGCTVAGQAATVAMEGCNYTFDQPVATAESGSYTIPTVAIKCPAGKTIVIKATTSGCTITVGSQTLTSGTTTGDNEKTTPNEVLLKANLGGITSTSTGGVCGTKGTTSTATYVGEVTVKGYSDAAHTTQVNLSITP